MPCAAALVLFDEVVALTFEIIRRHVADIHTVTDAQLIETMRFYAERPR